MFSTLNWPFHCSEHYWCPKWRFSWWFRIFELWRIFHKLDFLLPASSYIFEYAECLLWLHNAYRIGNKIVVWTCRHKCNKWQNSRKNSRLREGLKLVWELCRLFLQILRKHETPIMVIKSICLFNYVTLEYLDYCKTFYTNNIAMKLIFILQRKYMRRKFLRNERIILKCALSLLFIQTSGLWCLSLVILTTLIYFLRG